MVVNRTNGNWSRIARANTAKSLKSDAFPPLVSVAPKSPRVTQNSPVTSTDTSKSPVAKPLAPNRTAKQSPHLTPLSLGILPKPMVSALQQIPPSLLPRSPMARPLGADTLPLGGLRATPSPVPSPSSKPAKPVSIVKNLKPKLDREKNESDRRRSVFVGNLPSQATGKHIGDYFSRYGKVIQVDVPPAKKGRQNRCFCFVTFEHEHVVEAVLANEHHLDGHPDYPLTVQRMTGCTTTPDVKDQFRQKALKLQRELTTVKTEKGKVKCQLNEVQESLDRLKVEYVAEKQRSELFQAEISKMTRKLEEHQSQANTQLNMLLVEIDGLKKKSAENKAIHIECFQCGVSAHCVTDGSVLDKAYCVECWANCVKQMRNDSHIRAALGKPRSPIRPSMPTVEAMERANSVAGVLALASRVSEDCSLEGDVRRSRISDLQLEAGQSSLESFARNDSPPLLTPLASPRGGFSHGESRL